MPMIIKVLKTICRYVFFSVAGILGLVLIVAGLLYATSPVYKFEAPKPFSGNNIYNPYQDIDAGEWLKCIFHLHTKSWGGVTDGNNTAEEIFAAYKKLGFDFVGLSNYMSIDDTYSQDPVYVPIYEHGYGIRKTHQLALGAKKVVWRDYFFHQNLNHKQHIVDLLKKHSTHVALCHPGRHKAYLPEDLKYLSGYDLLEVQNGRRTSEIEWDAALSNGHKVWLIANDDAHSTKPSLMQREVTFVNVKQKTGENILERMSNGVAFGVHFPRNSQATMEDRIRDAETVTFPVSIKAIDDTLHVVWQENMTKIEFLGDNGKMLKTDTDTNAAYYPISPEDTYIRVKLFSPQGTVYFLNPVIRYSGEQPVRQSLHSIDKVKTFAKRLIIILIVSGAFLAYRFRKNILSQSKIGACLFAVIFYGCMLSSAKQSPTDTAEADVDADTIPVIVTDTVRLIFAGDIMGHRPQITGAWHDGGDSCYNFRPPFQWVKDYFSAADIAFANLEVTLAGPPYTGYPRFSSPQSLACALKDAGFDVLFVANNHILDREKKGMERTLDVLDSIGMMHTGAFRDSTEWKKKNPLIIEKNNFRLALLNYTYSTNGIDVELPNVVNFIDTAQMAADIAKTQELKPDFIIVFLHWGDEYRTKENQTQRNLATFLARKGANLIVGAHPHVVQPFAKIPVADGDSVPVAYSLGNFISNQRDRHRDGGITLEVTLTKTDSIVSIHHFGYEPFWVYRYPQGGVSLYRIIPVNQYVENPELFPALSENNERLLMQFFNDTKEIIETNQQ